MTSEIFTRLVPSIEPRSELSTTYAQTHSTPIPEHACITFILRVGPVEATVGSTNVSLLTAVQHRAAEAGRGTLKGEVADNPACPEPCDHSSLPWRSLNYTIQGLFMSRASLIILYHALNCDKVVA